MKVFFAVVALALFAFAVAGEKVGVVVDYGDGNVAVDCVDFSGAPSAHDVLMASRFSADAADFPPFGPALCGIGGVGCPSSNCFCDSKFWGFYYWKGNWVMAGVGIGSADDGGYQIAQDGGVIGFRWGSWGQQPAVRRFSEICPAGAVGGSYEKSPPPQLLNMTVSGNCVGMETAVSVVDEYGRPVGLARVNVLRRVPGTRFEREAAFATDGDGKGSVVVRHEGAYYFEAMCQQYTPDYEDVFFIGCPMEEVAGAAESGSPLPEMADGGVLDAARAEKALLGGEDGVGPEAVFQARGWDGIGVLSNWVETGWKAGGWAFRGRTR